MFTIRIKGARNPRNPEFVKLKMIFYKPGYARVERSLFVSGLHTEWNAKTQRFAETNRENADKNKLLCQELLRYLSIAEKWEAKNPHWMPVELANCFDNRENIRNCYTTVAGMIDRIVEKYHKQERSKNGKVYTSDGTARQYLYLKSSLVRYARSKFRRDFTKYRFSEINEQFLLDFCVYEQQRGAPSGTFGGIYGKLRMLYAVCAHAKREGIYGVDLEAFFVVKRKLYPKPTLPKAVSHEIIHLIEQTDRNRLTRCERIHLDLFLFSFYAGGISPIDICFLTHDNIKEGMLVYERMKCDNLVRTILVDKAAAIIERYRSLSYLDYVFPVIRRKNILQRHKYDRVRYMTTIVNATLRKICAMHGIRERVVWSSARSSFISRMIDEGFRPLQIAQMAGNSPSTIYKYYYTITNPEQIREGMNRVFG